MGLRFQVTAVSVTPLPSRQDPHSKLWHFIKYHCLLVFKSSGVCSLGENAQHISDRRLLCNINVRVLPTHTYKATEHAEMAKGVYYSGDKRKSGERESLNKEGSKSDVGFVAQQIQLIDSVFLSVMKFPLIDNPFIYLFS